MKSVICVVIALSFLIGEHALAEKKAKKPLSGEDTYKSAIKKAQELTLNQERIKAAQTLVMEIEKAPTNLQAAQELKRELMNLGDMFYTEKAQRIFELGRSLSIDEPGAGIEKFNEALAVEPGNQQILKELARSYLFKGECKRVLDLSKEALLQNPYNAEFFLLRIQSKVCLRSVQDLEAELANPFVDKEPIGGYLDVARAQHYVDQEKYSQALIALQKTKLGKFPETYYWRGVARSKLGQSPLADYESYVSLCKEQLNKLRIKYPEEPRTCKEAKDIEQKIEQMKAEMAG